MPKNRGFTLVELLVTISIVALLAVIGLVIYTKFIQNARDAKRQSDLRSIQSALEQYYADQFYYPMVSTSCTRGKLFFSTTCSLQNPTGTKTYLNSVPIEPISSRSQYSYSPTTSSGAACDNATLSKCTTYCLYASMENTGNSVPAGCSFTGSYNFGVTKP